MENIMNYVALYKKLLSSGYEEKPYRKENLGEGVSLVEELMGSYYMDSDGYSETDDKEVALFSYIDRKGKPLVKFRRVKDFSELKVIEQEAIGKTVKPL